MALEKQRIDIEEGIFPAVLVHDPCTPGKAHGCKAIVLGDHQIPRVDTVCQGKIHGIRTLVKDQGFGTGALDLVGGIAQQEAVDMVAAANCHGDVCHRAGIRIDQYIH